MKSDIDIIKSCLEGNQLAYKQLYEKYISYCYGICIRYSVNQSDIKDVVQIIFSQVFHSLKNYDEEKSKFKTWFARICVNHILSYKKKQSRGIQTQDFDTVNGMDDLTTGNDIESNIDKEYILSLLKKMPENYQIVFNMFIVDGYSHEEIASELKISTASSRVLLNRARNWMKKLLITINSKDERA